MLTLSYPDTHARAHAYTLLCVILIIASATAGEGGYVFTTFCLFVCLSVYRISQKVVDGFR